MIAGTLEIQMLADITRLQKEMTQATRTVGGAMKSIESSVASAQRALGALGIGLGGGYFVSLIKGSIDAMDKLNDLSKATSITVENLAGLQLAAKQSGGDLNSIADSINKLSQNMGKDAEKFKQLGISAKDPLQAFKQLSDLFVALEDPQLRAAVMAAALGRSWAGAAPLLAEGAARIQEIIDKGKRASAVTKEMAEEADKFNDQLAELNTTWQGLITASVGPMLPGINRITEATREAAKESGIFTAAVVANWSILFELFNAKDAGPGKTFASKIVDGMDNKAIASIIAEEKARKFLDEPKKATEKSDAGIAKALQEGMDEEVRIMAEVAQLTDDFRRKERELDQLAIEQRNQALIEAYDREQAEAIAHGEQLLQIEKMVAENKKRIQMDAMTFAGHLAGLMNTQSKKVFEFGKKAAIAQASYKGGLAVMDAWEAGMSVGGPWAPLVAAAYAAAAGAYSLNLINNIRSQEFGGGGGHVPLAPTQGASNISPAGAGGTGQQGSGQTTIINLTGDNFSRRMVRDLLEGLNEASNDGSRVIVSER